VSVAVWREFERANVAHGDHQSRCSLYVLDQIAAPGSKVPAQSACGCSAAGLNSGARTIRNRGAPYGPRPMGLTVDHTCNPTFCQRPGHLAVVSKPPNAAQRSQREQARSTEVETGGGVGPGP
jgi:hypothetical protein